MSSLYMTTTGTPDADAYLTRVRAALADLPPEELDDLLEDLGWHFAELSAETGGPLEARLGTPEDYAAELRASAGLPARPAAGKSSAPLHLRLVTMFGATPVGRQLRGFGSSDSAAFLRSLQPSWWVLRGYLAVVLLTEILRELSFIDGKYLTTEIDVFPTLGNESLGLLAVLGMASLSVKVGRGPRGPWARLSATLALNAVLILLGLMLLFQISTYEQI